MSAPTETRTGFAFTLDPADFAAVAGWVARRIPAKPKDPILAGVLVTVDGDSLTLSAFDYDVAAQAAMEVTGEGSGTALVSGRLLAELSQTFPAKSALSVRWDGGKVEMSCGSWSGTLPTMTAEDYPQLPKLPAAIGTVDAKEFAELVDQIGAAASKDDTHPAQTGIHLTFGPERIAMVAIDGYRAGSGALVWTPAEGGIGGTALVPASVLMDAAKVLGQSDEVITISLEPSGMIALVGETINIQARLIGADFKSAHTMSKLLSDTPATVDVESLTRALRRADLIRDAKAPVSITLDNDSLTVQVAEGSNDPAAVERVACTYAGECVTVGVNPTYLAAGLATIHQPTVEISVTHPTRKPIMLAPPKSPNNYLHMISPIRTRPAVPKS